MNPHILSWELSFSDERDENIPSDGIHWLGGCVNIHQMVMKDFRTDRGF